MITIQIVPGDVARPQVISFQNAVPEPRPLVGQPYLYTMYLAVPASLFPLGTACTPSKDCKSCVANSACTWCLDGTYCFDPESQKSGCASFTNRTNFCPVSPVDSCNLPSCRFALLEPPLPSSPLTVASASAQPPRAATGARTAPRGPAIRSRTRTKTRPLLLANCTWKTLAIAPRLGIKCSRGCRSLADEGINL